MATDPPRRRRGAALLAVLVVGLATTCSRGEPEPEANRPTIVLITIDTLRADHLGCYGYGRETSPSIDAFADEAIVFERAYAPMATTLPSHLSLLTSLSPMQHGVLGNFHQLGEAFTASAQIRTAAQMLSEHGYETAAFVSAEPLKTHSGLSVGFDEYDQPFRGERLAAVTTSAATRWLSQRGDRPLFLWVHYFDPHLPYDPPAPFDEMFTPDKALREFLDGQRETNLSPRVQWKNSDYDGEIRYVDEHVGRLLGALRAAGLYDEAAIVLTGDHGEGLGQHGMTGHGRTWNEQLHVPLILKLPESAEQQAHRRDVLAALVDVLPTLANALDLPFTAEEREQFAGVDLMRNNARQAVFAQSVASGVVAGTYCLIGNEWKYVFRDRGGDELYDLVNDPGETRNVLEQRPVVATKMKSLLLEQIRHDEETRRAAETLGPLSDQVIEALEELGYAR
jgi:arylsulfatase